MLTKAHIYHPDKSTDREQEVRWTRGGKWSSAGSAYENLRACEVAAPAVTAHSHGLNLAFTPTNSSFVFLNFLQTIFFFLIFEMGVLLYCLSWAWTPRLKSDPSVSVSWRSESTHRSQQSFSSYSVGWSKLGWILRHRTHGYGGLVLMISSVVSYFGSRVLDS